MNRASRLLMASLALALCALATDPPPVTVAFVELRHALDLSKAETGQIIELQLARPIEVEHRTVAPSGSIMHAHVSAVDKAAKHPRVSLVLDDVQIGEKKIPITGIIAAIAPKAGADLAGDAQYGMMGTNEPNRNDPSRSVSTESNAATAVATKLNKQGDGGLSLNADSRGAIGIDANLDWSLTTPPPLTVIEAKSKHLTLESRTQMLIRMAPPQVPQ
jgi:hypothetical protein